VLTVVLPNRVLKQSYLGFNRMLVGGFGVGASDLAIEGLISMLKPFTDVVGTEDLENVV